MPDFQLPAKSRADAAWPELPPDPMADPALYDGLLGRRIVAFLIDWAILLFVYGAFWVIGGLFTVITFGLLGPAVLVVLAALPVLYNALTIGMWGSTPGMLMTDVEIRAWDGRPADYLQAFIFAFIFYLTVPTTSGIALLFVFFNDRKRTVHDFLSGTVAVRRSVVEAS